MTTVIKKPDRRKGLRTMQDIPKETFNDMSPKNQMRVLFSYQKGQTGTLDDIHKILIGKGNGEDGLVTQTALNKQSLTRVWWFIALGIPAGVVIIGGLIAFV